MGRRPEPETMNVEPPRDPIHPAHGYRAGARIGVGDAARARRVGSIAAGIFLSGIVLAVIVPLVPPTPSWPIGPVPTSLVATPLPAVTVIRPDAAARPIPVYAGGLRWLDPLTGSMSGDAYTAPRGSLFVDPEGRALCVCLEIPWSQDRLVARVVARRFSAAGEEVERTTVADLESAAGVVSGEPIQVEAAIAPDGRDLWIVHSVRVASGWQLGLVRVDVATLQVAATLDLPAVPVPPADGAGVLTTAAGWITHRRSTIRASLRVSPSGNRLAVLVVAFGRPGLDSRLPAFQAARFVVDASLAPEAAVEVVRRPHDADDDLCDAERSGWASDLQFVTVCRRPEGDGVQPFVRIEGPGELAWEVAVGPPVSDWDVEWLLDAQRGRLYRWSTLAQVFTRLDVGTLAARTATFGVPAAPGAPADPTEPLPLSAPGSGGIAPWAPLTTAGTVLGRSRMVGSADGAVIYALGFRSVPDDLRDDRLASTGILAIDPDGGLLARWPPGALYDEIGFTPGHEHLVTISLPGSDGAGAPADWSSSLRLHDPRSGAVEVILGDVVEPSGFVPLLLPPNVSRVLPGP